LKAPDISRCILHSDNSPELQVEQAAKGNAGHGRYIAENVAMCIQCHSPREANGELIRSRAFSGAAIPVRKPSQLNTWAEYAPRIAGLPQYTDAQAVRVCAVFFARGDMRTLAFPTQ